MNSWRYSFVPVGTLYHANEDEEEEEEEQNEQFCRVITTFRPLCAVLVDRAYNDLVTRCSSDMQVCGGVRSMLGCWPLGVNRSMEYGRERER